MYYAAKTPPLVSPLLQKKSYFRPVNIKDLHQDRITYQQYYESFSVFRSDERDNLLAADTSRLEGYYALIFVTLCAPTRHRKTISSIFKKFACAV